MKQKVRKNGVVCWECLCQPNGFFKNHQPTRGYTGNHCTISNYVLEKPRKVLKTKHKNFNLGGFCPGVFVLEGFCPGGFCRVVSVRGGFCPGGFCPRPSLKFE